MHLYHGYRFEGLSFLIFWAALFVGVFVFEEEARRLHAWAFFFLMFVVTVLSIAGEYILYRFHVRSSRRFD
jgi:hypothetical protein